MFFLREPVLLSVLLLTRLSLSSPGLLYQEESCSVAGQACEIHAGNMVTSVPQVDSMDSCRDICYGNEQCKYMTYFGNSSFPVNNFCMIFSSCPERNPCVDCITEEQFCYETCGDTIVGAIGGNTIDIIADVEKEMECKQHCSVDSQCQYYTYHSSEDPVFPQICFLLSELVQPLQPCDHCSSGAADCFSTTLCGFIVPGQAEIVDTFLFAEPSGNVSLHSVHIGSNICEFSILGIGGGGVGTSGGGGSGGVSQASHVMNSSTEIEISVGDAGQVSSVITTGGVTVMLALAGSSSGDIDGGDGYSGGGGGGGGSYSGGDGGQDGGNGQSGTGSLYWGGAGKGSGADLSLYSSDKFALTPGAGGVAVDSCGGGGGGVLINGAGPVAGRSRGQGYGAGGGGCGDNSNLSGAIVIQIDN